MKSTLLRRMLAIVIVTALLSCVITGVAFLFIGRRIFAQQKAADLSRSAEQIASLTYLFQMGFISKAQLERSISGDRNIWDADIYIFDAGGTLWMFTNDEGQAKQAALKRHLSGVLAGTPSRSAAYDQSVGMIVGTPVLDAAGGVTGAVFLTKPVAEVNAAMNGLLAALVMSMGGALLLMLFPAYLGARGIARPLNQMSGAALKMAQGDFSVRAVETGRGEVGRLGQSLNAMSAALSETIRSLRLERDRMRSVLDGMGEGILAMDARGAITHCNPAAMSLLGGIAGVGVETLPGYSAVAAAMGRALAAGEAGTLALKSNGRDVAVAVTPFFAGPGNAAGVVALLQDVTEAVLLERTRREYVANVSHELRTPVAAIRSLAEALDDDMVKKDEDRARYYGYILREAMRLSRLIDDLLELSRLQSGAIALTRQRVDMNRLMGEAVERFSRIAQESGLTLSYQEPPEQYTAFTNADRVEQVLVVLLDNAIRYTPDEGEIRANLSREGQKLIVWVENPGELTPEQQVRVFERFYKADASRSAEGTGLGLSIAREVLALMGESISVTSENGQIRFAFTVGLGTIEGSDAR